MSPQQDGAIPDDELEREAMDARLDADGNGPVELCFSCLHDVPPAESLCPHCGAPISGASGIMPWERTFIYQGSEAKPASPLLLIGVWLTYFPSLVASSLLFWYEVTAGTFFTAPVLSSLFWGILSLAVVCGTTQNYFRCSKAGESVA
ncbi:MAG: hypothetical protein JWO89_557 [Verrucomicrobiaceae bacterium]|nr:hypothetical protein [Verrucomicrobiaceae bacterium]